MILTFLTVLDVKVQLNFFNHTVTLTRKQSDPIKIFYATLSFGVIADFLLMLQRANYNNIYKNNKLTKADFESWEPASKVIAIRHNLKCSVFGLWKAKLISTWPLTLSLSLL